MQQQEPESLKSIAKRLVKDFREKRDKRAFAQVLAQFEEERETLDLSRQDRNWLAGLRIKAD